MRRLALSAAGSALAALLLTTAPAALSQQSDAPASLVADSVFVDADGKLTAVGSVEAFQGNMRMNADKVVYDPETERIAISGPITLIQNGGETITLADQGDLSKDMQNGILKGARLVLDRQLQIAASELARVDGRYKRATRVRASSCEVCASNPTPLWEIRASRVIHDEQEKQIYFENATFRIAGLPVFWSPKLRMPDPTLDRARGFLTPEIRSTSTLGTGLKLPYFIPIGDSKDITLTPYVSTGQTRTLDARYRQVFSTGWIELNGALTRDDLEDGTRGYLYGLGSFRLPEDYRLSFQIRKVSDDAYPSDYDLEDDGFGNRLRTGFDVQRTRRNEYILGRVSSYDSLRDNESNATQPSTITDTTWHRRFAPALIGGEGGLEFSTHAHNRASTSLVDADGDGQIDGRDVASATIAADWRRNWVLSNGMVVSGLGELTTDLYQIQQDPDYEGTTARAFGTLGAEIRWPFIRQATTPDGAAWLVEPVAQVVWSPNSETEVPNEDSVLVEFDEGNLFSLDRFPGNDVHERGLRSNVGMSFTRLDQDGSNFNLTFGRVFRAKDLEQFNPSTGLDGITSDWMVFTQYSTDWGFSIANRAIASDGLDLARDELRFLWRTDGIDFGSTYTWLEEDEAEDRDEPTSELSLDATWDIAERWRLGGETRYDFETDRAARAGLGVQYFTECVLVDVSLSRRFTSSDNVRASTNFGLSVVLNGFGSKTRGTTGARQCSG